jgi:hypothetical protein
MSKKEARDGYLGDLPEEYRNIIMNIHKMIVNEVRNEFNMKKYDYLWNQQWAKSMLDEFLTMPKDKSDVGSVRIFKKGKRYSCMIQITAHVSNHRNTQDEEFFHGMLRNAHTSLRTKIRKKYDLKLECESVHGESFEGYDLWIGHKESKKLWELFKDKKTKEIKESSELDYDGFVVEMSELPHQLQYFICSTNYDIRNMVDQNENIKGILNDVSEIGTASIHHIGESYSGRILITSTANCDNDETTEIFENVLNDIGNKYFESDNTKELVLTGTRSNMYFEYIINPSYAKALYEWLGNNVIEESSKTFTVNIGNNEFKVVQCNEIYSVYNQDNSFRGNYDASYRQDIENELKNDKKSLNESIDADMKNPKAVLAVLTKNYINSRSTITQATANTYANIVTNDMLKKYTNGYMKFNLKIDNKLPRDVVKFDIGKMDKDFVSRFINGRESLNGFLHRNPEITLKVNNEIFTTIKDKDDLYYFFSSALKFYESRVTSYSDKIMKELMKFKNDIKQLISSTKLSAVVSLPLKSLFSFDGVDMNNRDVFIIKKEDIDAVCKFIHTIPINYNSPKEQKDEIIDALKKFVESYDETIGIYDESKYVVEHVIDLYDGKYDDKLNSVHEAWIVNNINTDWERKQKNPEIKLLQEKFGVKKLKKIPKDIVAYITIEAECIRDANDKMMIASYCLSKTEIVEWYLELLEVGSKKYIVPHTKPELQTIHTQLLACYKKIINTPIPKQDRPIIDIKYPAGYEG